METASTLFDAALWTTAAGILALLVLSAFFSGSETALTAASRGKLRAQADKGSKGAERALTITEDNERLIGSVLLGNNLVNIVCLGRAPRSVRPPVGAGRALVRGVFDDGDGGGRRAG